MKKILLMLVAALMSCTVAHSAIGPGSKTNRLYLQYTSDSDANWLELAADSALNQFRLSSGKAGATKPLRPLIISANGVEQHIYINTNGYIGLDTNPAYSRFQVNGTVRIASNLYVSGTLVSSSNIIQEVLRISGGTLELTDGNQAVGRVWVCTNATTGGGAWSNISVAAGTNLYLMESAGVGESIYFGQTSNTFQLKGLFPGTYVTITDAGTDLILDLQNELTNINLRTPTNLGITTFSSDDASPGKIYIYEDDATYYAALTIDGSHSSLTTNWLPTTSGRIALTNSVVLWGGDNITITSNDTGEVTTYTISGGLWDGIDVETTNMTVRSGGFKIIPTTNGFTDTFYGTNMWYYATVSENKTYKVSHMELGQVLHVQITNSGQYTVTWNLNTNAWVFNGEVEPAATTNGITDYVFWLTPEGHTNAAINGQSVRIVAGSNVTLSTNSQSEIAINSTAGGGGGSLFTNIVVKGQANPALDVSPAATIYVDLYTNDYQFIALDQTTTLHSTNRANGRWTTLLLSNAAGGTIYVTNNPSWRLFPTNDYAFVLGNDRWAVVSLYCRGTEEIDVWAAYNAGATNAGGGGAGEANTIIDYGSTNTTDRFGLAAGKSGVDLRVKTLSAGDGIALLNENTNLVIGTGRFTNDMLAIATSDPGGTNIYVANAFMAERTVNCTNDVKFAHMTNLEAGVVRFVGIDITNYSGSDYDVILPADWKRYGAFPNPTNLVSGKTARLSIEVRGAAQSDVRCAFIHD